jgi:small subunit ribosomal protein S6
MFIVPAEADESVVATAVDRITKVVGATGGEVSNIDRWGRRRFAFEVDRQTEGYYVVANFTAEPEAQIELERVLNLADEVLRFKVLVLPQKRENSRPNRRDKKEAASSPAKATTA